MSLFDPAGPELVEVFAAGGALVSGEPLPDLSTSQKEELAIALMSIGSRIVRSPERTDGWEEAYNAFVQAFQRHDARLSSRQLQLDLPNMLFTFALRSSWIPHLLLVADGPELSDITSPNCVHGDAYCAKPDHRGFVVVTAKQSIDWFKDRIRPAVLEWNAKATEHQMKYDAFWDHMMEIADKEPPPETEDTKALLVQSRKAMLEEYKGRLRDTNTGKPYSDERLYNARQHSMHKPQFYEWIKGTLSPSKQSSISFERFLTGKEHPIPRPKKA